MDGKEEFAIEPKITGEQLLYKAAKTIDLREIWFFGLQFIHRKGSTRWLGLKKKVISQDVKKESPLQFKLRVRFYPLDTEKELIQNITRKLFFLQVKEDILSGNICCPPDIAELLTSCAEMYEQHNKEEAVIEYLKIAQGLAMFGVTYFEIKDKAGRELWLGVDLQGIKVYPKENRVTPTTRLRWNDMRNLSYSNKEFTIKLTDEKFPDLKYTLQYSHVAKSLLNLCLGNHSLCMRHETKSVDVQQLRAQAKEQSPWKKQAKSGLN
ncbi:PREDICTED: moesin-like [Cyprinodon variegatus]|uniref:moesin-like n=1 Tax=Cyprinodon variegatus TaxID=28743 RepID=UPI00074272D9|nr:PREDICTED: moesin-like [Cyprinodon variegatus]